MLHMRAYNFGVVGLTSRNFTWDVPCSRMIKWTLILQGVQRT